MNKIMLMIGDLGMSYGTPSNIRILNSFDNLDDILGNLDDRDSSLETFCFLCVGDITDSEITLAKELLNPKYVDSLRELSQINLIILDTESKLEEISSLDSYLDSNKSFPVFNEISLREDIPENIIEKFGLGFNPIEDNRGDSTIFGQDDDFLEVKTDEGSSGGLNQVAEKLKQRKTNSYLFKDSKDFIEFCNKIESAKNLYSGLSIPSLSLLKNDPLEIHIAIILSQKVMQDDLDGLLSALTGDVGDIEPQILRKIETLNIFASIYETKLSPSQLEELELVEFLVILEEFEESILNVFGSYDAMREALHLDCKVFFSLELARLNKKESQKDSFMGVEYCTSNFTEELEDSVENKESVSDSSEDNIEIEDISYGDLNEGEVESDSGEGSNIEGEAEDSSEKDLKGTEEGKSPDKIEETNSIEDKDSQDKKDEVRDNDKTEEEEKEEDANKTEEGEKEEVESNQSKEDSKVKVVEKSSNNLTSRTTPGTGVPLGYLSENLTSMVKSRLVKYSPSWDYRTEEVLESLVKRFNSSPNKLTFTLEELIGLSNLKGVPELPEGVQVDSDPRFGSLIYIKEAGSVGEDLSQREAVFSAVLESSLIQLDEFFSRAKKGDYFDLELLGIMYREEVLFFADNLDELGFSIERFPDELRIRVVAR